MTDDAHTGTAAADRGMVSTGPDGRQLLEFRRSWPDPIEEVWSALTEPDRLARWIGTYDGERAPGGRGTFTMTHEQESVGEPMGIVECDPPRRLVVEWVGQEDWRLEVDLFREHDRTVLRFRQSFAPGTQVAEFAAGWHWYLDRFDAAVRGSAEPPAWEDFLARSGPVYGLGPA